MAIPQKPRLLYQVSIRRSHFFRRFIWSLLGTVASVGALVALDAAAGRNITDRTLLQVGGVVSVIVLILFGLRTLWNFWRTLRWGTVTWRVFTQGLVWTTPKADNKYGWSQLESYREGGRGLYLGKRPIFQWGSHRLKMEDGRVFRIDGKYGDLRQIGTILRRYAAHITGIKMGRRLRAEQPVKLNRSLTVWPGGISVGKREIPWSQAEVRLKNGRLAILQKADSGKFHTVKGYSARRVDNVGGLIELASSTIRNHQRERFEKK